VAKIPGAQEGLIDMQEEAGPFCPFARTLNVVLYFDRPEGMAPSIADKAIRESILRVAEFLGALASGTESGRLVESLNWPLPESHLPKAALVYFVQSQGNLRRTYLNGQPMDEMSPATISPLHVWRCHCQRELRDAVQQNLHLHPSE
jgi:glycine reductase